MKLPLLFTSVTLASLSLFANAQMLNGFSLESTSIPVSEIFQGGPPKDGIPALDNPEFQTRQEASQLNDNDIVLGIVIDEQAKAYPIRILNWHEVINDKLSDKVVVVTYCPLCGSGVIFDARIGNRKLKFGVSGLLYNSDVLLYDKETESLWSQLLGKAISGRFRDARLTALPVEQTTWKRWRTDHPDTLVLSFDTGYQRNYSRDPYASYRDTAQLYFPVRFRSAGLHPKEQVIGLEIDGKAKAWPFIELRKTDGRLFDTLSGRKLIIEYDRNTQSARISDPLGNKLPATTLYWFAWSAFHPETELFLYK